ncbi:hypothetical protein DYB36_008455 [Aphanomyces astaci]|uniref:Uncharacterized protein n=1 Tax=Aphanomyces astaci TaxID=112090 RepID=A0A397BS51_APHAT|nr:hypothetical protein DYB36_008455 [Aphanomyces astaci]
MNPTTDISKDNNKAQPLVFRGANLNEHLQRYEFKRRCAAKDFGKSSTLDTKVYDTGTSMHKHITELCILQKKLLLMGSRADHDMLGHVLYTSAKKRTQRQCRFGAVKNRLQLAQIIDRLLYKESETKRAMPLKRKVDDD